MKWMVETDIIVSAIYRGNPNHDLSKEVFRGDQEDFPTPFSLMELVTLSVGVND